MIVEITVVVAIAVVQAMIVILAIPGILTLKLILAVDRLVEGGIGLTGRTRVVEGQLLVIAVGNRGTLNPIVLTE